jgi:two-component sensor histidine kinase
MTNEEFEKRMEFILEQQAQFTVDIQQLREAQAQTDQVVNRLAAATLEGFATTLEGFKDVNAKIDALVDSHMRLEESQARTDESLRNLIAVVDRYFSKGGNGQSEEKN